MWNAMWKEFRYARDRALECEADARLQASEGLDDAASWSRREGRRWQRRALACALPHVMMVSAVMMALVRLLGGVS
jgi:hypothetical protein